MSAGNPILVPAEKLLALRTASGGVASERIEVEFVAREILGPAPDGA
jgi:hypothetical protein